MNNHFQVLVPYLHVADVAATIAFYKLLGFEAVNTLVPPGMAGPVWAFLRCGAAQLMAAQACEPVDPRQQAVLFYLYCDDVAAMRLNLQAVGVAAGPIVTPPHAPRGEFRVTDPDGYSLMIHHT